MSQLCLTEVEGCSLGSALNEIDSYLRGCDLSSNLSRFLREAYQEFYDQGRHPVAIEGLKSLLNWSEGHRFLSGFELLELCEELRVYVKGEETVGQDDQSLWALLCACSTSDQVVAERRLRSFVSHYLKWEGEVKELQRELEVLGKSPSCLSELSARMDRFRYELRNGKRDLVSWKRHFQGICHLWGRLSGELRALLTMLCCDEASRANDLSHPTLKGEPYHVHQQHTMLMADTNR